MIIGAGEYNTNFWMCYEEGKTRSEVGQCMMESMAANTFGIIFFLLIDLWSSYEIYKWAMWKYEDPDDETVERERKNPTCCVLFPLNNVVAWLCTHSRGCSACVGACPVAMPQSRPG